MLLNILAVIWMAWSPSVRCNPVVAGGISKRHHQRDDAGNYQFGYQVRDPDSHQFRTESGDAYGRVVGSYGLSEADGRHRIVDYVADEYGFRARVRTNEPGTGAENSAAVLVSQPGHPPAPPRIPQPVASGPTGDSPVKSALAYSGWPYSYPYYYSPVPLAQPNSLYPSARAPYLHPPGAKILPSGQYGQSPVPPDSGHRYAAPVPEAGSPATPARFQLATADRLALAGTRLPANYRVEPIPNGIRAVPVDSSATSDLGGGVYSPYPSGPGARPAYVGTRPDYSDPARTYYAYPPTDYRFSGSPTVDRVSKTVDH